MVIIGKRQYLVDFDGFTAHQVQKIEEEVGKQMYKTYSMVFDDTWRGLTPYTFKLAIGLKDLQQRRKISRASATRWQPISPLHTKDMTAESQSMEDRGIIR